MIIRIVVTPETANPFTDGSAGGFGVRRLTVRECEKLQGLPHDFTRYDDKGREIADSPRYRMIGNGLAVPVVEWIARRIVAAEEREVKS